MTKETMMSEMTQELIQQALDQDFNKANATFNDIMSVKLADVLDQEQIKLADQVYNGADPEDEEEITDDQLELDLDDEDIDDDTEVEEEDISDADIDAELDLDDEDDTDEDEGLEWEDDPEEDEGSEES